MIFPVNKHLKDAQKGQNLRSFSSLLQGEKTFSFNVSTVVNA